MTSEHYTAIGLEHYKDVQRLLPRLLLFGLLLLLSHVLEIKPSEVDAGGIKIEVTDIVVIHGGLALLFLYYFWNVVLTSVQAGSLIKVQLEKRTLRSMIATAKTPRKNPQTKRLEKPTPKRVKQLAWWTMLTYNLFVAPFALVVGAIIVLAVLLSAYDAWSFGEYLWGRLIVMDL